MKMPNEYSVSEYCLILQYNDYLEEEYFNGAKESDPITWEQFVEKQ